MSGHRDLESVAYIKAPSRDYYDSRFIDIWWPFWVWRIIAPDERAESDIFKQLILRLIKVGTTNVDLLMKLSCLHREFIMYLLSLLHGDELLQGWELTEKGELAIRDGYQPARKLKTFYLLQDAESRKLVPRVFNSLNYLQSWKIEENRVGYQISRKTGRTIVPYMLNCRREEPIQPNIEEVYDSIRSHRLDRNRLDQAGFNSDKVDLHEDQVEILDDAPFPVYMNLQLFTERGGERPWYISDPASMLPSLAMLNRVADRRLKNDKFFAERVSNVLGVAMEDSSSSYEDKKMQLNEQIKAQLVVEYSWVLEYPQVEKYVRLMLKDLQELENTTEKMPWMRERLVSSIQKVCESIVKLISPPDETLQEWKKVKFRNEWQCRDQIKEIYLCCKAVDDNLAFNFSKLRSGQVKEAMHSGNQSLRQLLAALVLRSPDMVEEIDKEIPRWLNEAISLGESRNKAEHANEYVVDDTAVSRHHLFVKKLLKYIERNILND